MLYQLLKNGIPVAVAYSARECDKLYLKYDCDEVRGFSNNELENKKGEDKCVQSE